MKPFSSLRPALLAALLPLAALGTASAQTASPTATAIPASKPATETATPSPGAAVNTSTPEPKVAPMRKELLEKYDKNHDGVIDADERAAFAKDRESRKAERLQKYDKNHDGKLDESERAAMRADREAAKKTGKEKPSPTP